MLVLLDLDNTLVDRDGAFRAWATSFVDGVGGGPGDVEWLVREDAGGYRPRAELAGALRRRMRLDEPVDDLVARMRAGASDGIRCYPGVPAALVALAEGGARLVIVTNGAAAQQRRKIVRAGLDALVDGVVVSEEVGVGKPDPAIFLAAMEAVGEDRETWMVGDHGENDIAGARALGIRTAWVSHGRTWAPVSWTPDLVRADPAEALRAIG